MYNEGQYGNEHLNDAKAIQNLADELAIKNMIEVLKSQIALGLSNDEFSKLVDAVKSHTLMNAEMVTAKTKAGIKDTLENEFRQYK